MSSDINIDRVHLEWCIDILKRMQKVLEDTTSSEADKIRAARWLVKQALKVERED